MQGAPLPTFKLLGEDEDTKTLRKHFRREVRGFYREQAHAHRQWQNADIDKRTITYPYGTVEMHRFHRAPLADPHIDAILIRPEDDGETPAYRQKAQDDALQYIAQQFNARDPKVSIPVPAKKTRVSDEPTVDNEPTVDERTEVKPHDLHLRPTVHPKKLIVLRNRSPIAGERMKRPDSGDRDKARPATDLEPDDDTPTDEPPPNEEDGDPGEDIPPKDNGT